MPKIVNGVVTELGLKTTDVTDISPIRALMGLKVLKLVASSPGKGGLSDLSPLAGMPLTGLWFNGTEVTDLSPLQGMNLTMIAFTPKDITKGISVVRQMKSLKTIGLRGDSEKFPAAEFWKKYDAGEFGLPDSTAVNPDNKPITDFNDPAFQQWMQEIAKLPAEKQVDAVAKKLQELNPEFDGRVGNWLDMNGSPTIENGVVTGLGFFTDSVSDISPVRALAGLRELTCGGKIAKTSELSDLRPLREMKLQVLRCYCTHVFDLSPLHQMPLTELNCGQTPVSDLSPLAGMKLRKLYCDHTKIADLSPLQGMPLKELGIHDTPIADLSPLHGMPLSGLNCFDVRASDLSPLEGMNLSYIAFTPKNITMGLDAIRQMKSLKTIAIGLQENVRFPPAEFWKRYDAGEFGK